MSPENIPKFLISQFTIVNNIVRVGEKLFVISEKSLKYSGEGRVRLLYYILPFSN